MRLCRAPSPLTRIRRIHGAAAAAADLVSFPIGRSIAPHAAAPASPTSAPAPAPAPARGRGRGAPDTTAR